MISIRKAEPEDFTVLEELYTELEKDAVFYQPEHFVLSGKGERTRQLAEILKSENQIMLVAADNDKVIGFAHVMLLKAKAISCLKPQTCIYLQDLIVTAGYRSRGIGSMLLEAAKQYGKDNNADFFRTQVFPMNKAGLRFYIRNGFAEKMITIECSLK